MLLNSLMLLFYIGGQLSLGSEPIKDKNIMVTFTNTIQIDKPVKEVFSFLATFENLPKWNYYIMDVSKTEENIPGQGITYHQIRKNDEQYFEVLEFIPNEKITIKTLPGSSLQFQRTFIFKREGEFTVLSDEFELETKLPAFIEKLFVGKIKNAVRDNLQKLKELLEKGATILQNGKVQQLD